MGQGVILQRRSAFGFQQDRFAETVIFDGFEDGAGVHGALQRGGGLLLRQPERAARQIGFAEPEGVHLLKEGNRFVEAGFGFFKVALRQIDLGVGVFEHGECFHNNMLFEKFIKFM